MEAGHTPKRITDAIALAAKRCLRVQCNWTTFYWALKRPHTSDGAFDTQILRCDPLLCMGPVVAEGFWPRIGKTGTTTLGKALKHLGYRHRHGNRRDLLERHLAGDSASALAETAKFNAFEDWPWPLLYEDLFGLYGDAGRYILTTRRSPEVWLNSLKAHSLLTNPDGSSRSFVFGYKYPHGREREHIEFYTRHNDAVRKFFKGRDDIFLEVCWEVGDSWEKLCEFLGHSVPRSPFPHANRTEGRPIMESDALEIRRISNSSFLPCASKRQFRADERANKIPEIIPNSVKWGERYTAYYINRSAQLDAKPGEQDARRVPLFLAAKPWLP